MVDKSFSVFPKFISDGILGNLIGNAPPTAKGKSPFPTGISHGFDNFIVSIKRACNKFEEQQVVNKELQLIKTNLSQPDISVAQIRDYVCRLILCHTLNYDVSFGLIHAVKLMQMGTLLERKTGYVACSLMLHRDHEISILLISNTLKDLSSSNILEIMMGLSGASQLIPIDAIPHLLSAVIAHLKHPRELVRQKAVMCLHQFQLMAPDLLEHSHDILQRTVFDKDPGVMAAAVHIVQFYIERDTENSLHFGENLISILKQITSRRMTSMFDYHNVPFPWLQIQILKCLTKLVIVHGSLLPQFISVLKEILQKTSIKENIAFCILYECIRCIVTIKSPKHLLDEAAKHIQMFLQSANPNLKFIGVKLLVMLVKVNPEYSVNYQQLIVKSLENPDTNIQRKMHRLLYEIANESNVLVVCSKLLDQLKSSVDRYWKTEVMTMVIGLIQRFDVNPQWRIDTVFAVLLCDDGVMHKSLLDQIFNFLENKFCSSQTDVNSQKMLVTKCVSVLLDGKSGTSSIHVALWTLGELCLLLKNMSDDRTMNLVIQHLTNNNLPYHVHSCAVTTLQQFVYNNVVDTNTMATKLKECLKMTLPIVIRQRLSVIKKVCENRTNLNRHDNNTMDMTLTFLDSLVVEHLKTGAIPFVPTHLRTNQSEPVDTTPAVTEMSFVSQDDSLYGRSRTDSSTSSTKTTEESDLSSSIPIARKVWGKQGRLSESSTCVQQTVSSVVNTISEEDSKEKELVTALFGGFLDKENEDDEKLLTGLQTSDSAGWRRLHTEKIQTDNKPETKDHSTENSGQPHIEANIGADVHTTDMVNACLDITTNDDINMFTDDKTQDLVNEATTASGESAPETNNWQATSLIDTDLMLNNLLQSSSSGANSQLVTGVDSLSVNDCSAEVDGPEHETNKLGTYYRNMSQEPPEVADSMYTGCDNNADSILYGVDGDIETSNSASLYSATTGSLYNMEGDS